MPLHLDFAKGHGTRNDFVLVPDPDGRLELTPDDVRFLCDRRAGVGADGLIHVVRGGHIPEWSGDPQAWFMDYRNADGSVSEMCGNGVRVFLRYLKHAALVDADADGVEIGTRAGVRTGHYLPGGQVRVWMGRPTPSAQLLTVSAGGRDYAAVAVDVGNPHAVSVVDSAAELADLDLTAMPSWAPAERFPQQTNLEFVHVVAEGELAMRVYERGVGETESCGTGTVAAATAVAFSGGRDGGSYRVHVPGGTLGVDLDAGNAYLTGPAEIVFSGSIDLPSPGGDRG